MKTIQQLIEEIVFEAGGQGIKQFETIAKYLLQEVTDKYTALSRYPELKIVDQQITVANLATGLLTLPTNFQSANWGEFRIRLLGDPEHQRILTKIDDTITGPDTGPALYYSFNATQIRIWPWDELDVTDEFYFTYFRKADLSTTTSNFEPDPLVETVKLECIGRLGMMVGNKQAGDYFLLKKEAFNHHNALADLPGAY